MKPKVHEQRVYPKLEVLGHKPELPTWVDVVKMTDTVAIEEPIISK